MGSTNTIQETTVSEPDDGLVRPIYKNGRFQNPFDTHEDRTIKHMPSLMKAFLFDRTSKIPWNDKQELQRTLPLVRPDFQKLNDPPVDKVQFMWIGHASVLVQFDGLAVLTDPVWSPKCGPLGKVGPKRYREAPCSIEELPNIDAVVISHNHYDHLEYDAVVKLNRKFGDKLRWYVATGQRKWMLDAGCKNVVELTWWQEDKLEKDGKSFTFAATPAQHCCQRTATDANKSLWCSWVVKGPTNSFYFGGDTAYCTGFKQIGQKYGPFSLAAIPIGAYEPRWFMRPMHVDVEEAVCIHNDVKARNSVGIHWGTYKMTIEHYLEPREKLADIVKSHGYDANAFTTVKHGHVTTTETMGKEATET